MPAYWSPVVSGFPSSPTFPYTVLSSRFWNTSLRQRSIRILASYRMYALSICLSRAHHSPRCSPISSRHSFPKPALAIYFSIKSNPQKILSRTAFQNPVLTVSPLSLSLSTQSTTRIPCPPACTSKNSSNTHPGTNFLPKSGKYSSPGMLLLRISW